LAAAIATLVPFVAPAAAGGSLSITWSQGVSTAMRRSEAGAAFVDGKLFLFGGYFKGFVPMPRVDAYDPTTRTWHRQPDMPEGITHMGVATDGTYVYIAGGYLPKSPKGQIWASNHVWRFDPVAGTFTAMPALPSPRGGGALVLLGRTLHYFGGSDIRRHDMTTHWTFELDTDTVWHKAAPLPTARNHLAGVALGGLVYALGGQQLQDTSAVPKDEVDSWDPATNTWTVEAPIPTPRSHVSAATTIFQGMIVIVGGDVTPNAPTNEVDAYDATTNSWSTLSPLPITVYAGVAADVNGVLMETTGATPSKTALTYQAVASP
jgi:N-acetylneuraminic acid mutarotase